MKRRTILKDILWILVTVGVVAGLVRFTRGLGATTNLDDATPWGFWIGFDVIAGVALAAGGFTLAATIHVFHLDKYRPLLRPAILTAFLGYIAVIVGLIADLGLPWNIWRPIVHWQHHSALFEVAWCVMLYTTVLALEFMPTALEHPLFGKPIFQTVLRLLKRFTVPIVIIGIALSTLHQSSLGTLLLINPLRVHELWYSPILPVLFFTSAAALGLMTVTLEGFFSAFVYRHKIKLELFSGLGKATAVILWLFLAIRVGDLTLRGVLPAALDGSWQSMLFLVEISISTLIPAILLSIPSTRNSLTGIGTASFLTVFGMILHRLSASVIAVERPVGASYFPNWVEISISIGIISGLALVFLFFAENLNLFGPETMHADEKPPPYAKPRFDPVTKVRLAESLWDTAARRALLVVVAIALAITMIPERAWTADQTPATPVMPVQGLNVLRIDGNRSGLFSYFDHKSHGERLAKLIGARYATETDMCVQCHHLSNWEIKGVGLAAVAPQYGKTGVAGGLPSCRDCHSDMYSPTSTFDHDLHIKLVQPGGNQSCAQCHVGGHSASTAVSCSECHANMCTSADGKPFNYIAPSYVDAMHGLCIDCHEAEADKVGKPLLGSCVTCHHQE